MKKLLMLSLVAAMVPSVVMARGSHPMAGCGLGYLLLSHDENEKVMQILGATTNATFGTQTFGITSGTSGCTQDGAVKLAKEAEVFAEVNFDSLRREMAIGNGEYVETFASLLGATDSSRPAMLQFFRTEYASLFPSASTTSGDFLSLLGSKLIEHPELLG